MIEVQYTNSIFVHVSTESEKIHLRLITHFSLAVGYTIEVYRYGYVIDNCNERQKFYITVSYEYVTTLILHACKVELEILHG